MTSGIVFGVWLPDSGNPETENRRNLANGQWILAFLDRLGDIVDGLT